MLYSMAQQAMFFVSQQGLAASHVRQPSNSASLSLLAEHLLDEGLTDIKLFGDLSDGAFAFFIGGNDSLSQIKGISFHTVELTPIVSRIQSKTVIVSRNHRARNSCRLSQRGRLKDEHKRSIQHSNEDAVAIFKGHQFP